MPDFTIVLGNKRYSSWSLRGWLMLKQGGGAFDEIVIPLDQPQTRSEILSHSPAGKVPVLKTGDSVVWDSLAIAEYLHEAFPEAGLWPSDAGARAQARSISAEMHAGFAALRMHLPMDVCAQNPSRGARALSDPQVAADVARIVAIWTGCRERYGGGDFLFGDWCAADAMYAPVVLRFRTYGINLPESAGFYPRRVLESEAIQQWLAAAECEVEVIDEDEKGR